MSVSTEMMCALACGVPLATIVSAIFASGAILADTRAVWVSVPVNFEAAALRTTRYWMGSTAEPTFSWSISFI